MRRCPASGLAIARLLSVAAKHKPGQPIAPHVKERVAEIYGLGLSYSETAGACGISEKSVERILGDPAYRKIADDIKKHRTSMGAEVAQVVRDLLTAEDSAGLPAHHLRKMGAELYARNPAILDAADDGDGEDAMLPGVILRFPNRHIPDEDAPVHFTTDDLAVSEG